MEGLSSPLSCGSNSPQQEPMGFVRAASVPLYEVGRVVGEGANAVVYQCQDVVSGVVYALKCPRSPRRTQMSAAEVAAAARVSLLRHVNVVTECPSPSGGAMMEYIEGGTLREALLKQNKPFDDIVASGFIEQILQGLAYLHSKEVVHGDIKCSNILLEASTGTCKLSDIGRVGDEGARHLNGVLMPAGTPAFMAPEVIRTGTHSKPSDIWSIGCTVLEMVTGEFPWLAEDSRFSAMFKIAQGHHPPIPGTVSDLAKSFLAACFHKEGGSRPTASELLLHRFSNHYRASQVKRFLAPPPLLAGRHHDQPQKSKRPHFLAETGKSQSLKLSQAPIRLFDPEEVFDSEDQGPAQSPIILFRRCASDPTDNTKLVHRSKHAPPTSPHRGAESPLQSSPRHRRGPALKRMLTGDWDRWSRPGPESNNGSFNLKLSSTLTSSQRSPLASPTQN